MSLFGRKRSKGSAKPLKRYEVNTGPKKTKVSGTNEAQEVIRTLSREQWLTFSITELTAEQQARGFPHEGCLNVNAGRVAVSDEDSWVGYLDPQRQNMPYLIPLVKAYRELIIHGKVTDNGGKFRVVLVTQPKDYYKDDLAQLQAKLDAAAR